MPLGKRLGVLAKAKELKQTDLAAKIGLSLSQVNRFFSGQTEIKGDKLVLLMAELGIDLNSQIDTKISQASGVKIQKTESFGEIVEQMAKALKPNKREALIEFIAAYGSMNMSPEAKTKTRQLKELI